MFSDGNFLHSIRFPVFILWQFSQGEALPAIVFCHFRSTRFKIKTSWIVFNDISVTFSAENGKKNFWKKRTDPSIFTIETFCAMCWQNENHEEETSLKERKGRTKQYNELMNETLHQNMSLKHPWNFAWLPKTHQLDLSQCDSKAPRHFSRISSLNTSFFEQVRDVLLFPFKYYLIQWKLYYIILYYLQDKEQKLLTSYKI